MKLNSHRTDNYNIIHFIGMIIWISKNHVEIKPTLDISQMVFFNLNILNCELEATFTDHVLTLTIITMSLGYTGLPRRRHGQYVRGQIVNNNG